MSICNGLRPNLDIVNVPQLLKTLIVKCWDDNPLFHPEAHELFPLFRKCQIHDLNLILEKVNVEDNE
ncbi:9306_t:CDS:2 [Dentiscutata erythropus]|uniref:9306_t:CDS:1 n=1 Tax=Dentiscutata erythropus TaxID=1348616 RepID=A0A9N9EDS0_9GLOM|nr:9306_t:CDS:2 [Dentiscutata erythropus]